jgi:putative transposase
MKYQLDKGCHAVYALRFHYICCVKYRRKVLDDEVSAFLKQVNESVASKFGVQILEQETDRDHLHIIFSSKPQIQLSKFINSLKAVSARLLCQHFPALKTQLWGGHFWSPSYFLTTVGEVKLDDVKRYVQSQGSHP